MSRIQRTSALSLTVMGGAGLVGGRLLRPIIESFERTAPRVGWSAAIALLLSALIVASFAWNTWQSLHKHHERMTSDHGIKLLSLAKACALVGALVAGGYFGYALGFADSFETPFGKERVIHSGLAGLGALLLMVAGLLLERALQLPGDGEDDAKDGKKKGNGNPQTDATPA